MRLFHKDHVGRCSLGVNRVKEKFVLCKTYYFFPTSSLWCTADFQNVPPPQCGLMQAYTKTFTKLHLELILSSHSQPRDMSEITQMSAQPRTISLSAQRAAPKWILYSSLKKWNSNLRKKKLSNRSSFCMQESGGSWSVTVTTGISPAPFGLWTMPWVHGH